MKKNFIFLFLSLFCFFLSPASALEVVGINDSDGSSNYIIWNQFTVDPATFYQPNHVVYDETQFFATSDDIIDQMDLYFNVNGSDKTDHLMRFSCSSQDGVKTLFVKTHWETESLFDPLVLSVLAENNTVLVSETYNFPGARKKGIVSINENNVFIRSSSLFYFPSLTGNVSGNVSGYLPAESVTMDIHQYPEECRVYLKVLDDFEGQKNYDSFIMSIYWLITQVFPDSHNVLYAYFQIADAYFSAVTWLMLIFVSVPFFYVFLAGVAGLSVCVLKGTFKGGVVAGLNTFISIMKWPFTVVKWVWEMVMRVIEVLKPI